MCLQLIMCTMANNITVCIIDDDGDNMTMIQHNTCACVDVSCAVWCYVAPSTHKHSVFTIREKNQLSFTWIRREHALYHIVVDSCAAVFFFLVRLCCLYRHRCCCCCCVWTLYIHIGKMCGPYKHIEKKQS